MDQIFVGLWSTFWCVTPTTNPQKLTIFWSQKNLVVLGQTAGVISEKVVQFRVRYLHSLR